MKRLLITGASGFVCGHCLGLIEKDGGYPEIYAVNRSGRGQGGGRVVWHAADLRNPVDALQVIKEVRPTHLFHGAWIATPGVYLSSADNIDWLQAGIALVRAFAEQGGQRFVGVGSSAEYAASDEPCEEVGTPLQPGSVYGECKAALWYTVQALARHYKMQAAWGRLFLPYGPGDLPARLIPTVISHLRAGKPLSLSHGEQKRDFIYAPDAAKMFVRLLNSDVTGAFNVGTGEPRSVRSVIEAVAGRFSARDCLRFGALPMREGEPPVLVASMKKFDRLLGAELVTPFGKTLDALIASQPKSAS